VFYGTALWRQLYIRRELQVSEKFNPADYLRTFTRKRKIRDGRGQEQWVEENHQYLDVKYRLLWFRQVHPEGFIDTVETEVNEVYARIEAVVYDRDPADGGRRLGKGRRQVLASDFKDYVEKPHLRKCWCIPPEQNAAFVACMEDVLDLYQQQYCRLYPVICMDEKPYQLLGETRAPIPMKAGIPERQDGEYVRNGTCSIFVFTEPLAGWRHVTVCERRTRVDWANQVRELLEVHYPKVKKIRLVMDNLNTHTVSSLYEAFTPDIARNLAKRLEIHYTPKHGQLAQHSRNRTERNVQTVSRTPNFFN
jgi:hypothetical protein